MEKLGNDYGLYVYHMFARYSCLHPSGEPVVYRTMDGKEEGGEDKQDGRFAGVEGVYVCVMEGGCGERG